MYTVLSWLSTQALIIDFHMTSKPSLQGSKFVKLILLIGDIKSSTGDALDLLGKLYSVDNRSFSNPVVSKCFTVNSPSNKALGTKSNCKISGNEINCDLAISTCFWAIVLSFALKLSYNTIKVSTEANKDHWKVTKHKFRLHNLHM